MNRADRRAWAKKQQRQHDQEHLECGCTIRRLVAVDEVVQCPNPLCEAFLDLADSPFFIEERGRLGAFMPTSAPLDSTVTTYLPCPECDEEVAVECDVERVW